MRKLYVFGAILAIAGLMSACCKDNTNTQYVDVPTPAPVTAPTTQQQIDALVADENSYRESLGQTALTNGLSCTVQAVSAGQWLSSSSPGYNAGQGVVTLTGTAYSFNSLSGGGFNVPNQSGSAAFATLPAPIQPLFENINFRIVCNGNLVVLETEYMAFSLGSDDGAILTVDGTQVINNDGNHGIVTKTGTKLLRDGVHTFQLQYAQTGAGQDALVLTADGQQIDNALLYH